MNQNSNKNQRERARLRLKNTPIEGTYEEMESLFRYLWNRKAHVHQRIQKLQEVEANLKKTMGEILAKYPEIWRKF
jgi:predicted nuclease with TOPRIM domain